MHELKFQNPVFNEGLNYTVRCGHKWKKCLKLGDWIRVGEGCAVVTEVLFSALTMIPQRVYDYAHDPRCRTQKGLQVASNYVTCIGFVLLTKSSWLEEKAKLLESHPGWFVAYQDGKRVALEPDCDKLVKAVDLALGDHRRPVRFYEIVEEFI